MKVLYIIPSVLAISTKASVKIHWRVSFETRFEVVWFCSDVNFLICNKQGERDMINGTCWVTGWKKISGRDQSQETEIYFTPNFFSEEKAHARMFLINCTNISLDGNFTCKKSAGYEIKILNFPAIYITW